MAVAACGDSFTRADGNTTQDASAADVVTGDAQGDVSTEGGPGADASSDAPAGNCDLSKDFANATLVGYRSTQSGPPESLRGYLRLTLDEKGGTFDDGTDASKLIATARTDSNAAFVGGDGYGEGAQPAIAPDGNRVYYAIPNGPTLGTAPIMVRTKVAGAWGQELIALGERVHHYGAPYVLSTGKVLYAIRSTAVGQSGEIMRGTIGDDGLVKEAVSAPGLGKITTRVVAVTGDESIVLFAGGDTNDTAQIYEVRRTADGWTAPRNLSFGNLKGDVPMWISPDGCRLYFRAWKSQSERAVYVASRPRG
jgi:hypothetical protein